MANRIFVTDEKRIKNKIAQLEDRVQSLKDNPDDFLQTRKENLQERRDRNEDDLADAKEEIDELKTDPDPYINRKLNRVEKTIPGLPDREPETPDNTTMKKHLENLRGKLENDPDQVVTQRLDRLTKRKNEAFESDL